MKLANRIWTIAYPVLMYYVAISLGIYIAQMIFGADTEHYMLCKIIGSLVAIPVVFADYKQNLIMTGRYKVKNPVANNEIILLIMILSCTVFLSLGLNNIISMSPLVTMSAEYQNANASFYGGAFLIEFISAALITPFLEELLHRGVVYGRLRAMMGIWPSVIVSALIFAGLHFNIVQFVYAFLLGMVFAIFVEKTGKLYPVVIAHMVANGLAVIRTETGFLQSTVDGSASAWFISIGFGLIGIGILIMIIGIQKKEETNE
ncbi:MAG: CPBP family intramembrane metalloprotease [Agathobacter sp.]|nr:CPBP family intramembrane metalloprotease [Agathobacter sp.]